VRAAGSGDSRRRRARGDLHGAQAGYASCGDARLGLALRCAIRLSRSASPLYGKKRDCKRQCTGQVELEIVYLSQRAGRFASSSSSSEPVGRSVSTNIWDRRL